MGGLEDPIALESLHYYVPSSLKMPGLGFRANHPSPRMLYILLTHRFT